jgi:undecaprenyl pyrophosphate phosphatase UppP
MAPAELRVRFWVESVFASVTGVLAVVTIFWHDWIEAVFGVDPDHGNGSAEWLVVLTLAVVTVALAVVARHEWRRARRVIQAA